MTIYEMNKRMDGFRKSEDRNWHKIRVLGSILLSPHLKKGKKIRPEDLIKLSDDVKDPSLSEDEKREDIERKMRAYRKGRREPIERK